MIQVLSFIKQFIREDFNPGYYATQLLFWSAAIFVNYYFDLGNSIIGKSFGKPQQIFYYFVLFAGVYFFSLVSYAWFHKDFSILKSVNTLCIILVMLLILSWNASSYLFYHLALQIPMPPELTRFLFKCLLNIVYSLNFLIPLFIFRKTISRELSNFYGLTFRGVYWRAYLPLLIVPIILAGAASFFPDFLNSYPTYDPGKANAYWNVPPLVTLSIYELLYGVQFIFVELFFRGFLVIGMAKYLGRPAVMSMVSVYVFWHFDKPLAETIGSVFGGYILGVLAYSTQNIWGGIVLHAGTAWAMDLSAILQKGAILKP